jgi:DNA-binding SARP family transcriptional activator
LHIKTVRYRILGPLELRKDDQWIAIGPAKWRALLAVLLCEAGQIITVDRLIDDQHGRILVTVRSGYSSRGYQLLAGAADLDSNIFEALAADGRRRLDNGDVESSISSFGEALSLWRGRPFADVPPTPAVVALIDRLEECRLEVAEAHMAANLRCGRHAEFVSELESLVAAHPLRKRLCGQLIFTSRCRRRIRRC